ncbi:MAG: hypothetical protein RL358_1622 [Pseudomonadota bacterium]
MLQHLARKATTLRRLNRHLQSWATPHRSAKTPAQKSLLMPCSRHSSGTGLPPSAYLRTTIVVPVCLRVVGLARMRLARLVELFADLDLSTVRQVLSLVLQFLYLTVTCPTHLGFLVTSFLPMRDDVLLFLHLPPQANFRGVCRVRAMFCGLLHC